MTPLPPLPQLPPSDATEQQWNDYNAQLAAYRAAAAALHAEAQAATADAMAGSVAAQQAMAAAMALPAEGGKPTRFQVARGIAESLCTRQFPAPNPRSIAATAKSVTDELALLYPDSMAD